MKKHLARHWRKYLLALLLPILVWGLAFYLQGRPGQNEKLRILYVGTGLDTQALQEDLTTLLPNLREITVTQELSESAVGGDWLTYRQFSYDILIFSGAVCPENMGQNYFARLTESMLSRFPGRVPYTETAEDTELTFALVLQNESTETVFCSYLAEETEETYLMFLSPESVNFAGENGRGAAEDDAALVAAQYLSEVLP